jgi:hypothetical protein
MLTIECSTCGRLSTIKGQTTFNSWEEPGEVVVDDREDFSECCVCIKDGGAWSVVDEDTETFGDEVI